MPRNSDWEAKEPTESQIRSLKQHSTMAGVKKIIPATRGECAERIGMLHYLLDQRAEIKRIDDDEILRHMARYIRDQRKKLKEEKDGNA